MGYTHYFYFKVNFKEFSNECLNDIKVILNKHKSILTIYEFNEKAIMINGRKNKRCEDLYVNAGDMNFNFCKTRESNPYDIPVCEILLIFKKYYKEDFYLTSDGLYMYDEDDSKQKLFIYKNWKKALKEIELLLGYKFEPVEFMKYEKDKDEIEDEIRYTFINTSDTPINNLIIPDVKFIYKPTPPMVKCFYCGEKLLKSEVCLEFIDDVKFVGHKKCLQPFISKLNEKNKPK